MTLNLIFACSENGIIGNKGKLPWHLPEDLEHFKNSTMGHSVVMGRKTWESLPSSVRPMPNRNNIVISGTPDYEAEGASVMRSVEETLAFIETHPDCFSRDTWVIGGQAILKEFEPYASGLVITLVETDVVGDTYMPALDMTQWQIEKAIDGQSQSGLGFQILYFKKKTASCLC